MAKTVFRPGELTVLGDKVVLDPPDSFPGLERFRPVEEFVEEASDIPEYTGPTADELRREAEAFKARWETEKEAMIDSAKREAESIISRAEERAGEDLRTTTEEAAAIRTAAGEEAEKITAEAREQAERIEAEAQIAFEVKRKEAEEQGCAEGREAGYTEGKAEAERLVRRMQTVLERVQDKRLDILNETEQQIIDLVLLISRKVVKTISENQRGVIIENVKQALQKFKVRGNITIRVNMADVKLATEHTKEFIALVEGAKSLQIAEDSTVDPGGCVIETDFGELNGRISSQLSILESKILETVPFRAKAKTAAANGGA